MPNLLLLFPLLWTFPTCFGTQPEESLRNYEDGLLRDLKIKMQHTLDGARIRRKRQAGDLTNVKYMENFTKEYFRFGSTTTLGLPYLSQYNLTTWKSVQHMDRQQVFVGTDKGELILFDVTEADSAAFLSSAESQYVPLKIEAFSFQQEQWFAVLKSSAEQYLIQLYQRNGPQLVERQVVTLEGKGDFNMISVRGITYMIVTTYGVQKQDFFTYEADITLYEWSRTQFDIVDSRASFGARYVTSWTFDGVLYFAVSQEVNDAKNYRVGSPIFMFNAMAGTRMRLIEKLETDGPAKVVHFTVNRNHYLLFGNANDSVIYWWSNEQFLEWQVIPEAAGASDMSVLVLPNGEVILVIVLKAEILFLTLDASGHYVISFTMQVEVSSLQFMSDGRDFYALALMSNDASVPSSRIWKVGLQKDEMHDMTATDALVQCISTLDYLVQERQKNITAMDLNKVWVNNKSQVISVGVVVNGTITSKPNFDSIVDKIIISSEEAIDITPSKLHEGISAHDGFKQWADDELELVMSKSKEQVLYGTKRFSTLIFPRLNLPHAKGDLVLNDVEVSRLFTHALKRSNNKAFTSSIYIRDVFADQVTTRLISGINPEDIVLLYGSSHIFGSWSFSDVQLDNLMTGLLNDIDTLDLITADQPNQIIKELKSFRHLRSNSISSNLTNGEFFKNIEKEAVRLDGFQAVESVLEFEGKIDVLGSITADSINDGLSLALLDQDSVKWNIIENITGIKTFEYHVSISEDADLYGLLNNLSLKDDIVTVHTQQIFGDINFVEPLTLSLLEFDTINGVHLEDFFLLGVDDSFNGHKWFTSVFTAHNIKTSDNVTINGIDLYKDFQAIIRHQDGIVYGTMPMFHDVKVLGDLVATQGINGLMVSDIPSLFWLKSYTQEIDQASLNLGTFEHIETSLVNGLSLEHDVVHIRNNVDFNGEKTFDEIQAGRIDVSSNSYFNGLQLSSFHIEDYDPSETGIRGMKTFIDEIDIKGGINTDIVNNIDLRYDFLSPDAFQIIPAMNLNFSSLYTLEKLFADKIDVQRVNNFDFLDHAGKAVFINSNSMAVVTNKAFGEIQAREMSVEGQINGINVTDLLVRAITLDASEYITGAKNFAEAIHVARPVTSIAVNDLELASFIDDVMFLDIAVDMVNKKFVGNILATTITAESLNGLNLRLLAADVMSKTQTNRITAPMTFIDATFNNLHLPSFNGIALANLLNVHTNEQIDRDVWFLSDVDVQGDLIVNGLANGCSLNEVSKYGLRTYSEIPQYFIVKNSFGYLSIEGNANVKQRINEIHLASLIHAVISSRGVQEMVGDLIFYPGIEATKLILKGLINSTNLQNIIDDAVLSGVDTPIQGYKIFHRNLKAEVAYTYANGYVIGAINGVDMNKLFLQTVTKSEIQEIFHEKTFQDVQAYNVTILENINGIKFPNDVILANDEDYIKDNVWIFNTVEIQEDLKISGLLANVELNKFLNDIVTLSEDEVITSDITVRDPSTVRGNMLLLGSMNSLSLEKAVKTSSPSVPEGIKSFVQTLTIYGNLNAIVNGIDIKYLSKVITRTKVDETIGSLVFAQPVNISTSVIVGYVDDMNLGDIVKVFEDQSIKINNTLNSLRNIGTRHSEQIYSELREIKNQMVEFAYFVLHKEFNLGSAERFLNGATEVFENYITHSLVMWSIQNRCLEPGRCCRETLSYWLTINNDGSVSVSSGPMLGRYFPVVPSSKNNLGYDQNFMVWTNATVLTSDWCHRKDQVTSIQTYESRMLNTYMEVTDSASPVAVTSFVDEFIYLTIAYNFNSWTLQDGAVEVYRGRHLTGDWKLHQILLFYGTLSMDQVIYSKAPSEVLLALGTRYGTYPSSFSSVYRWNATYSHFDLVQNLPSQYVRSIHWIERGLELLLAVANLKHYAEDLQCTSIFEGGHVDIYSYHQQLTLIQTIRMPGVIAMVSFTINGETYLAAASRQYEIVAIYHWQGYNQFIMIQSAQVRDVTHLNYFWREDQLYLIISSDTGSSKVLRAVSRGQAHNVDLKLRESELADEPTKPNC